MGFFAVGLTPGGAAPSIAGIWKIVETADFSVIGATNAHDFSTVLNGDSNVGFGLFGYFKNDTEAVCEYTLRYNATGAVVGDQQETLGSGTNITGVRNLASSLVLARVAAASNAANNHCDFWMKMINPFTGRQRANKGGSSHGTTATNGVENWRYHATIDTPASGVNITKLGLAASQAEGIGDTSKVHLIQWTAL